MRGGSAVLEERECDRRHWQALRDEAATWTKDTPPALFVGTNMMRLPGPGGDDGVDDAEMAARLKALPQQKVASTRETFAPRLLDDLHCYDINKQAWIAIPVEKGLDLNRDGTIDRDEDNETGGPGPVRGHTLTYLQFDAGAIVRPIAEGPYTIAYVRRRPRTETQVCGVSFADDRQFVFLWFPRPRRGDQRVAGQAGARVAAQRAAEAEPRR